MECKEETLNGYTEEADRINRNIMECKELKDIRFGNRTIVLIETLWNVKSGGNVTIDGQEYVLIETLWNVKRILPSFSFNPASCINRNIMECKVLSRVLPRSL